MGEFSLVIGAADQCKNDGLTWPPYKVADHLHTDDAKQGMFKYPAIGNSYYS